METVFGILHDTCCLDPQSVILVVSENLVVGAVNVELKIWVRDIRLIIVCLYVSLEPWRAIVRSPILSGFGIITV